MSRKSAELLSNLVAIKGAAVPMPDMPSRAGATLGLTEAAKRDEKAATQERDELAPLNFRIPASFRREFRTYAATHDLKLNELLRLSFNSYRKAQGD